MSGGYTSTDLNGVTIRGTARLVEVHDRFGNKLVYQDVATGRRISHFHKNATQASGAIEIGMTSGLVSSIKDPRNQITRFYYETKKIGQTALKLPVLTKVVLPDGGVRRFGLHLDFRKPTTHNTALPQPHDPTSIFTEGNLKPRKKKKWLTDDSIESAVAPYLTLISDPSGRTTQFSYDEPTGIDSAQQVHIKATVDFSEYDDIDGNEVFNQALKDSIIASAKLEASPDIVEEMAERGYFKLPTPRENQPMGSPYQDDPYNSEPYENAEGIYFRSGLMSVPAVKKVVSSDINGDGSPEVVEIAQQDNMLKFLTTPNGANPDVSSGVPASQQQANARPQVDLRVTTVTDGIGSTVYRFGDAMMISYSEETPPANPDPSQVMQVQPQLDDIPAGCHMAALIVRKLAIERAGTKETYYFNPRAGMALDAAIDASGNMIRYHYTDPYPQAAGAAALTMAGVAMPGGDTQLQKFHSDPTSETRYKGNVLTGIDGAVTPVTRSFAYTGPYRLQTRVVDERGVLTVQELKDNVLRRLETIYPNVNVGTQPIRQEEWKYDDARFPSFVTEHRVKKLGSSDPTWVTDLVKQYEADANGRIWKEHVVLPTGNLTTIYTYDGNGNKTTVTTPRGLTTGFIYDSMNRIERIIYQDLKTKEFDYDKAGRKVADIDENGYTTTFRYSPGGFLLETRRHMADDDDPTPDDLVTKTVFDSRGRAVGAIDANGNVTTTDYDTLDRPVRVIDAKGGESQFHYDLTKNAGGSIFSGSSFKPTRTRDALGYVTEVTYDYRYMPVKVAKEYQLPTNTTGWQTRTLGPAAVTETVYDNLGNATDTYVKRTSGAALGSDDTMHTHVDFDALGRPWLTTVEPNHATMRHETETQFTSTGLAWKTIEFRNISVLKREFEREFDAAGREVKAWAPAALTGIINKATTGTPIVSALTQTAYDADGNVSQVTDPLGRVTDFHYNNRNRKWKEELPAVEDYDQTPAVMTRPVTVSTFDGVGNVLTVTDPRGTVTKSVFDRAYRATHAYAAFGTAVQTVTSTQYDRNGNTLCVIDQNGNATRNAYDALNRLIGTSVNPTTGNPGWPQTPGSGDIVVANVHDAKGNLIAVADGSAVKSYLNGSWVLTRTSGHVTEFDYDGLNRKVATRWDAGSSLQKQESSSHDAVAMVSRTDAANRVTQYAYDALFRLTTTTYVGDTAQNHTRYYKGANPIPASGPGPQTAVHYGNGSDLRDVTYSLNRLNQVTSERSGGVFHYHNYDIAGNRLLTRHYNRTGITQIRAVVTEYDALNRAKKIHETTRSGFSVYPFVVSPATDKTTQYAYDLSGNTRFKSVPNGQRTTTTYDRLGRKMVMSTLDAVGGLIAAFDYSTPKPGSLTDPSGYDNAGNVRHVVETYSDLSTRTVKNDYDCTHRLTRESLSDSAGEVITEYRYDAANNRIEKEVTGGNTPGLWSFIYGNITNGRNTNQLVSYFRPSDAATLSFTYDAHGNRSARHKNGSLDTEYSYDRENRLLKHKLYGSVQRDDDYVYDFRSRRVVRDESGASNGQGTNVEVSFSGGTSVQEYAPGATTPTVEYVRGSDWGGGVGGILYTIRGGAPSYNVYNSRGDVVSRTDSTGDVTWQAAYEAFGTRTKEVGSTQERQTANTKDEDLSGLLNEGMRYRDLEAGIFLTRDPAGFVDGPNTYTYVRQNPWTSFDPLGLWGWKNLLSTVLDCVPVVSTIKSAVELVAGRDVITGEPINRAEAAVSLAASFTPGGKMAVKAAIKGAKIAEKVMDAVDTAETAVAVVEAAATGDVGTIVEAVGEAAISRVGHRKKGEGGDPSGTSQRDQKPANEAICTKEGGGCFVAGTPVHTPEGFERIENIEVGDQVWSYNLETEQWEASEVTRTFTHSFKGELVTVSYDGGSVVATDNHPFWVVSGDDLGSRPQPEESGEFHWTGGGAWVCAGDLREGDVLLLREGDSRTTLVASLDFREVETTVYNFEVRGLHNYAVSNGGILVHNNCDGKAGVYIATNDTLNERYVGSSVDVPARIADPDHAQADLLSHPDTKTEFVPVDMGGLAEQGDKRRTLNTAEQYEMDDRGITPKTPGVRNVIRARAEKKMDSSEKQYGVRSRMGKARPLKKDSDNEEKDDD
jgi:RHS repeat-associated protein